MVYEAEGDVGVTGVEAGVVGAEVMEAGVAEELQEAGVVIEEMGEAETKLVEQEVADRDDLMTHLLKLLVIKGNVQEMYVGISYETTDILQHTYVTFTLK